MRIQTDSYLDPDQTFLLIKHTYVDNKSLFQRFKIRFIRKILWISLLLNPDPPSQYGSGTAKSVRIHPDLDPPQHWYVKFRDPFREKKEKKSVVPVMGKLLRLKEEGGGGTRLRLRDQTLATVEDPASSPGTRPLCNQRWMLLLPIRIIPFNSMRIWIRILLVTLMQILILPFIWCGSGSKLPNKGSKPWKSVKDRLIFHTFLLFICKLMRIWIQLITSMRIRIRILPFNFEADPNPQH